MNQHFFMVFVEGERTPAVRYSIPVLAENEAKRLSKLTGKKALVLCSLKSFEIKEFEITDCRPPIDDLPF